MKRGALIGFKGRDARERAREAASHARSNPDVVELPDGSFAGAGDILLMADDSQDRMLWGARGTSALESAVFPYEPEPACPEDYADEDGWLA